MTMSRAVSPETKSAWADRLHQNLEVNNMNTIGEIAAYAVRGRCVQNRTKLYQELKTLDVSPRLLWCWEKKGFSPTAYSLSKLARAGYDVMWILLGDEHET
jgi:hypothetical protein